MTPDKLASARAAAQKSRLAAGLYAVLGLVAAARFGYVLLQPGARAWFPLTLAGLAFLLGIACAVLNGLSFLKIQREMQALGPASGDGGPPPAS
jgi:hypothetical protein